MADKTAGGKYGGFDLHLVVGVQPMMDTGESIETCTLLLLVRLLEVRGQGITLPVVDVLPFSHYTGNAPKQSATDRTKESYLTDSLRGPRLLT